MNETLTSSEAARICGVSFRTVIRWIERNELQGYRLPGRGDYRVLATELRRFMSLHGIPEPEDMPGQPKRILVVDDEAAMASAIRRTLRRDGFEVATASDGFLAGSMLHIFKPHLMTLDIHMPGIDGFGVLRFLREQPPPFPLKVLVVSGESEPRLRQALELGAHGALAKPFENEELRQAVARILGEAPRAGRTGADKEP
ncbi:excisionase family DNA binding protein [Pelomonas aquatica]|uniref:Excisionase family DNA binding protein n=1 Tax=Pelomonas aquatica TaxID=431058 RepID=A0ABU1ZF60_9BURK|nr:response regulator [Pelomonas aquatica]MDR7298296.1 excisionase family DNA binding protein [Pelomonas aquatica]